VRKLVIPVAALLLVAVAATPAQAVDDVNSKKLRDAVTVNGILAHERVLQRIANQNGGNRASGLPGYAASAAYVKQVLRQSGYQVREQTFEFPWFQELAPAQFAQVSPTPTTYETVTYEFSATGDVTGVVVPTNDIQVPPSPTPSSTSGCEASDFTPAPAGLSIALIQRGTCFFEVKAANAQAAGYDAVVFMNEGQPGREEPFEGSLNRPFTIPAVGVSFADGAAIWQQVQAGQTVTARVVTSTDNTPRPSTNILADSPGGDPNKVVVVGAHLDSVQDGEGINDNGSGTATILEIAEQIKALKIKPRQKLRFAFWGAEESGLIGSEHYVSTLPDAQLAKIYANLNFDMLGSPNYVRFVYDGDGSDTGTVGPAGSEQIEAIFNNYFAGQGLETDPTAFDGRSDYGPFIAVGIPAGGLFSGAEGIKTPEQAAVYGGTAGVAYDPCYHQECDDINNLSTKALAELGDGAAHAVLTLAMTKTGFFPDGSRAAARSAQKYSFDHKGGQAVR
jgi:Zn-dependent M28 family amino/carboxypeptidase